MVPYDEGKMKKKTMWIHHAMKNQWGEGDIDEKGRVSRAMREYFGLHPLLNIENDKPIFIHKQTRRHGEPDYSLYFQPEDVLRDWDVFYPDIFVKDVQPIIIVEIDGPVHWQNSKVVRRTNYRNECYEKAGFKFIWLTRVEAREKVDRVFITNLGEKLGIKPSPMPRK